MRRLRGWPATTGESWIQGTAARTGSSECIDGVAEVRGYPEVEKEGKASGECCLSRVRGVCLPRRSGGRSKQVGAAEGAKQSCSSVSTELDRIRPRPQTATPRSESAASLCKSALYGPWRRADAAVHYGFTQTASLRHCASQRGGKLGGAWLRCLYSVHLSTQIDGQLSRRDRNRVWGTEDARLWPLLPRSRDMMLLWRPFKTNACQPSRQVLGIPRLLFQ
ncbi:hypothetical protein M011DRAFT_128493 [Sporormia fimetaria CBS 119925]|uniref:Uncharacterized protein n=1 Tax=Sporormia fimetaria CBS 119925 TaxID=1340428 RepID=A0A6A6V8B3_9PLEO|nr:hypothetical protein M011DRAFT_128493 [Sporormia fimetaria CBS 119925]